MSDKSKALTPPGELINVHGRMVHIQRSGTGSPTIIFESGIFGESLDFHKVQPVIAKLTSTISYDRAGHGYSDPSTNLERVTSVIVNELSDLLETLNVLEPLVLIGWSAGAHYMLQFAYDNPERVAGIVLIDSTIVNSLSFYPDDIAQVILQKRKNTADLFSRYSKMKKKDILDEYGSAPPWQKRQPDIHKYYEDTDGPDLYNFFSQIYSTFIQELNTGERYIKSLGAIPLSVICAIGDNPNLNNEQNKKANKIWVDLQRNLSELSTNNKLIEVDCGHDIANEKPEVVIEAILEVVNHVRSV
jgi:pimeloyl-ACP methyl ester carboxylesterase